MKKVPYASVDFLRSTGETAEEICKSLIGKVDQISQQGDRPNTWEHIPQVQIIKARVDMDYDPVAFPEGFVRVDTKEVK